MAGFTNKGKFWLLNQTLRNVTEPTNLYVALVTSATAPTADTNTLSQLTEIAAGNGYTSGGFQLTRNATDFDVMTEDDTADSAYAEIKDITWTASVGNLPASGNGARYAVLTDDNVTVSSREVYFYWDLVADRTVSVGQTLTIAGLRITIQEAA